MRKVLLIFTIFSVLITSFIILPTNTEAETLNDLNKNLATLKAKAQAAKNSKKKTESEIQSAKNRTTKYAAEIEKCEQDIDQAEKDIEELEIKILEKDKQIKDLMSFFQIANSESFYLNYVFGATDYEDFIYRCAVVEQLAQRNDELLKEMKELIVENQQKIVDKEKRQVELKSLTEKTQQLLSELDEELKDIVEGYVSVEDEVKAMQELIAYYKKIGCSPDQDLDVCVGMMADTSFIKPLKSGVVTSEFGYRFHPTKKIYTLHAGIDLGGNREGTSVFAAASGIVVAIFKKTSCGGNQVYINHNISGKSYTSVYMHLLSYSVKVGDKVTKGQVIAKVGGGSGTPWDSCSTGAHLHFGIASGHYLGSGKDAYTSYSTYVKKLVNPRDVIYFPKKGKYW